MISRLPRPVRTLSNLLLVLLVAGAATLAMASTAPAATITVTTTADETITNDAPSVSLREAIISINNQADTGADVTANRVGGYGGNDTINFNIAGSGVKTLSMGSSLPTITRPLTINATTQGVAAQGQPPLIALDGTGAGASVNGLTIAADVTLETLAIGNFSGAGVGFNSGSDNSTLVSSYIGTNAAGTAPAANGVGVQVGASNITVGGTTAATRNVISGNAGAGVAAVGGGSLSILGNFIGTDRTGSTALPNGIGVQVATPDATVGGTSAGSGNVISGNAGAGISVLAGSPGTLIPGNLIGTDASGSTAIGNATGIALGGDGTQVGGSSAPSRNVISGNTGSGMLITGTSNSVVGNFIGVNSGDSAKLGNGGNGILVTAPGTAGNSIGDLGGNRNVISGNGANGVFVNGSNSNVVAQNFIGTDLGATLSLGNGSAGVRLAGAKSNQIGGTPSQQAVIANNGDYGINASTNGNFFQGVLIYNNAAGTILVAPGPTPIASSTLSADRRTINLSVSGLTPSQTFSFEVYAADAQCALRSFLGFGGGGSDASGTGTGSLTLGAPLPAGSNVGALVTDGGSLGTSPPQGCPTSVLGSPAILGNLGLLGSTLIAKNLRVTFHGDLTPPAPGSGAAAGNILFPPPAGASGITFTGAGFTGPYAGMMIPFGAISASSSSPFSVAFNTALPATFVPGSIFEVDGTLGIAGGTAKNLDFEQAFPLGQFTPRSGQGGSFRFDPTLAATGRPCNKRLHRCQDARGLMGTLSNGLTNGLSNVLAPGAADPNRIVGVKLAVVRFNPPQSKRCSYFTGSGFRTQNATKGGCTNLVWLAGKLVPGTTRWTFQVSPAKAFPGGNYAAFVAPIDAAGVGVPAIGNTSQQAPFRLAFTCAKKGTKRC